MKNNKEIISVNKENNILNKKLKKDYELDSEW